LKATKATIIRQAQLAKKDIANGRLSTHAQQAVDTLADYSNPAVELLELALDEAARERPDQALVDSLIFCSAKHRKPCALTSRRAIRPRRTSPKQFASGWSPRANPVRRIHP
jgi:hypothetical protein